MLEFEAAFTAVLGYAQDSATIERCKRAFFVAVNGLISTAPGRDNLCEILAFAATKPRNQRRELIMFIRRGLVSLPEISDCVHEVDRDVCKLFKDNFPDLMDRVRFGPKDETFFKIQRLEALADEA